jgi:TRAP-type C4-dicarboxylate transport system permease small subunit
MMRRGLTLLLQLLHRLEDGVLVLLLLAMIAVAVTQIVLRNGFDGGLLWADSFLRVLVLWIGLAGAMAASRNHRHINIDVIGRFLPPRAAQAAAVFSALFTTVVAGLLAWNTLAFVRLEYEAPSPAFASVPTWVCESIMPFAFAVIALRYLILAGLTLAGAPVRHAEGGA